MKFIERLFSPTILIISFILLIYTFYKSEIIWDGYNRDYYKNYYLISLISISFSIITFFINYKIKQYLIISGMSLIVSLYLLEGYLTFKDQIPKGQLLKEKLYEKQTGNKWDKRNKLDIYNELKKNNTKVTVAYHPSNLLDKNYSTFPLSGPSNLKTIFCNENGYYSIYQSDRYGFNNPNNEWDKKEIEYLLVGDSFTQGACVNRPNDISSVLRSITNKSVLNLGIGGNGPLIEYATLREYLDTNVKKVLWVYYEGNDLSNLRNEKTNTILINYLNDLNFTQNLKFKQKEIDEINFKLLERASKNVKKKTFKSQILKFIKIRNSRYLILKSIKPKLENSLTPEFKKILELTKSLTSKNNSKLYFVYLPEYSRYKIDYDNTNYNLIKNIVTELNIPFIDINEEVFKKEQNPLKLFPFELLGHYNVNGYKKVAETIYKVTRQ